MQSPQDFKTTVVPVKVSLHLRVVWPAFCFTGSLKWVPKPKGTALGSEVE